MKTAIILCGGKGTRLSEETYYIPKPMVEIGGKPILWHIMKTYSFYGINRFIIALGYKGNYIKQYFINYKNLSTNISLKINTQSEIKYLSQSKEKEWEIIMVETGINTLKGGRIKMLEKYVNDDVFHLTYGDAVSDVNINKLSRFHKSHNCLGTVTAVRPPSRFGEINIDENHKVVQLKEKAQMGRGIINGGYFVFNKELFSYLTFENDFEFGPIQQIVDDRQLMAYQHDGFWQCMDNIRERDYLEERINNNDAPWIIWDEG